MTGTEKTLLYAAGGFLLYKLFIAPRTSNIPTQAAPVYTNGLTNQPTVTSNTGSILALGTGLVTTIIKSLSNNDDEEDQPASTGISTSQQTTNAANIDQGVSNMFSSVPGLSSSNASGSNFGLPTSFNFDGL